MKTETDYTLILRLKGAATRQGRVPLSDLVELCRHVQLAVERVGRVLRGQDDSQRPGPKPRDIRAECMLEVVALNKGSFEVVLDVPRPGQQKLEGMQLGEEAAGALVAGLRALGNGGTALPVGFDAGVLYSVRDIGHVLRDGIESIEFEAGKRKATQRLRYSYDRSFKERMVRSICEPITNERVVEGRLLMADFKLSARRCRIHPPSGRYVGCTFAADMMDTVQEFLRRNVRVTGEAQIDTETNQIKSLAISDIEPVAEGEEGFEGITAEDFWQEKSIDQLAEEQGVRPVERLDDVLGRHADLWGSDDEFERFVNGIYERRRGEASG
jgi:hypothetical protein